MGLRSWWERQRDTIRRPAPPPPDRAPQRQDRVVPPPTPRPQPQPPRPFDPSRGRGLEVSPELKARHDQFRARKARNQQADRERPARERRRDDRSR